MRKTALIAAILLQLLVLLWMAGGREWIVRTGPTIWLRTAPVDPRDPFRGDYVTLGYAISTIRAEHFGPALREEIAATRDRRDREPKRETVVFAALQAGEDGVMAVTRVDLKPPATGPFIRGRVAGRAMNSERLNRVAYGIDAFFVEQGQGRALERAPEGTPADVVFSLEMRAALGKDGTAVLTGYRWSPLGLGVGVLHGLKTEEGLLQQAPILSLTIHNSSSIARAVVLPANWHTLYLQIQASWSGPVVETVRAAEKTPLTDAELRILPPGKGITVEMPVPQRWLEVLEKNEGKPFRLLYTAPGTEACAHLEHAEAIWPGRLESQGLGSRQLWEK